LTRPSNLNGTLKSSVSTPWRHSSIHS